MTPKNSKEAPRSRHWTYRLAHKSYCLAKGGSDVNGLLRGLLVKRTFQYRRSCGESGHQALLCIWKKRSYPTTFHEKNKDLFAREITCCIEPLLIPRTCPLLAAEFSAHHEPRQQITRSSTPYNASKMQPLTMKLRSAPLS